MLFGQLFVSDEQTGDIRVFRLNPEGGTAPLRVLKTAINGGRIGGHRSVTRDEITAAESARSNQLEVAMSW